MRIRYSLLMLILGLLVLIPAVIVAQENTPVCPTIVQQSFTATEFLCESVADGQACIGNGVVSTTPKEGKVVTFANPGELASLADIQRMQLQSISTDNQAWTSVKAKLVTATNSGQAAVADFLIFGDAVLTEATQATATETTATSSVLPAVVQAGGGVIVRQDSRVDANNIWQLVNNENVQAIGRSADNQWIRIAIPGPNGGAGWVFAQFLNVDPSSESLPFVTNASPIPEISGTVSAPTDAPSYRFESLKTNPSCVDTPDSGIMLQSPSGTTDMITIKLDGVEIEFNGAIYITAQVNEKMTIYVVEGEASASIGDSKQAIPLANMTEITLNADLQAQGAPSAATPYSQATADLLVTLPIRLLSRNFEIRTSDGTAGAPVVPVVSDQQATPVPTEVPQESVPAELPANCPTLVQESYTATEFVCEGLSSNQACIGNGLVTATALDGVQNFTFDTPGNIVPVYDIQSVSANVYETDTNIWTSTVMKVNIAGLNEFPIDVSMVIMGEVDLTNKGELPVQDATLVQEAVPTAIPTEIPAVDTSAADTATDGVAATIEAPGVVIVRGEARVDSSTVAQLNSGDTVSALGRSVDQQWVQIRSQEGVVGWIFANFVTVPDGLESLPIIDSNAASAPSGDTTVQSAPPPPVAGSTTNTTLSNGQPEYLPMQAFNFVSTNTDKECGDLHDSGVLLQSPDTVTDNVRFLINNTEIMFKGTIFIKAIADVNMNVTVLEGTATIVSMEIAQTLEAGQQASVKFDQDFNPTEAPTLPSEYNAQRGKQYQGFPIRLLPRQFDVIVPPEDDSSTPITATKTPTSNLVAAEGSCVISAGDQKRNIRTNAGKDNDTAYVMQPGEKLVGVSQKRGPDQYYWYETSKGWIRMDAGVMSPECESLPLYGVVYDGSVAPAGGGASGAPIVPTAIPPTAPPPPALVSDGFGDVCSKGGLKVSTLDETSGTNYQEFGGVWTGTAGKSITFSAEVPYFRKELVNVITFVNEDGSPWLGSIDKTSFTITFDSNRRFRVRVASLLGDTVTLKVNCN